MSAGILLDTSALIHRYDETAHCHDFAKRYFSAAIAREVPLWLSSIAVAEYQVKANLPKSLLKVCRVLPFDFSHALKVGEFRALLSAGRGDRRDVNDDFKLIAQATVEEIPLILTDDKKTLAKYAKRLQTAGVSSVRIQLLSDGFDETAFSAIA